MFDSYAKDKQVGAFEQKFNWQFHNANDMDAVALLSEKFAKFSRVDHPEFSRTR